MIWNYIVVFPTKKGKIRVIGVLFFLILILNEINWTHNENNWTDTATEKKFSTTPCGASIGDYVINSGLFNSTVNSQGFINGSQSIGYNGYYHNYEWIPYFLINGTTNRPINNLLQIEPIHNLTDFSNFQILKGVFQHPDRDVKTTVFFEVFPNRQFFIAVFCINSSTLNNYDASVFLYNDLDVNGISTNKASYSTTDATGYGYEGSSYIGWASPVPPTNFDVGKRSDIKPRVEANNLQGGTKANNVDIALATKYSNSSLKQGQAWVIPIIYGFGTSESSLFANSASLRTDFTSDFSLLDFKFINEGTPIINVSVLNGGVNSGSRTLRLIKNGSEIASQQVNLQAGECSSYLFNSLGLTTDGDINFTVKLDNTANDYDFNDVLSKIVSYQSSFKINVKDLSLTSLPNTNVSLYYLTNQSLVDSALTDLNGNVTFFGLKNDQYSLTLYSTWLDHQIVLANITHNFPTSGRFLTIATNVTDLEVHVKDVGNQPMKDISVFVFNNETTDLLLSRTTAITGNVSMKLTSGGYDIFFNYSNYGKIAFNEQIADYNLSKVSYLTYSAPMSKMTFHLNNSFDNANLSGARVEFYNWSGLSENYGSLIGYEISDAVGNVSIYWNTTTDYSIRIIFFDAYRKIQGPPHISTPTNFALNFTDLSKYIYENIEVAVGDISQFKTNLTLYNPLPLIYTYNQNISLKFLFNVTSTGGDGGEGPRWANSTNIKIRNQLYELIYEGAAEIIETEIGNHSFILNTSSGFFTAGNPSIYSVYISAVLEGYTSPDPIVFTFNLYNIATLLNVTQDTIVVKWGEIIQLSAYYFDNTYYSPIDDGSVTVSWIPVFDQISMDSQANGTYFFDLDTSLAPVSSYLIIIKASKSNYVSQEQKISLILEQVPTLVNGSILYDSYYDFYVSVEDIVLSYDFRDSFRDIPVPDVSTSYSLKHRESNLSYNGSLSYNAGFYVFNPFTSTFPIGTYTGIILFSKSNYATAYASLRFDIKSLPTAINDTTISRVPYTAYFNNSFTLDFEFREIYRSANVTYLLINENFMLNGQLTSLGNGLYLLTIPKMNKVGVYTLNISVLATNHTEISLTTIIQVEYPKLLGLPQPYVLIAIGSLIGAAVGFVAYRGMRIAMIPRFIKQTSRLLNAVAINDKETKETLTDRIGFLNKKYGDRWNALNLESPFKAITPEIKEFMNLWEQAKGTVVLPEFAINLLEDLILFDEEERNKRLKEEKIPEYLISKILAITKAYEQKNTGGNI